MLLLWAVVIGIVLGGARALYQRREFTLPDLHLAWLVPLAFIPQWLVFFWPRTRTTATTEAAITALVGSQALMLLFAWRNRRQAGFWLLSLGLALNLAVIVANGGLMPISPKTVARIAPPGTPTASLFPPGSRLGTTKDIVLLTEETRLWWLSDVLLFPRWFPLQFAYSIGDVLVALGVVWVLWQSGAGPREPEKNRNPERNDGSP